MKEYKEKIMGISFIKNSLQKEKVGATNFVIFQLECDEGWYKLIYELCQKLEELNFNGYVTQIKEKFGGLRFYVSSASEEQYDSIYAYEKKSYSICEICGEPGEPSYKSWIKTVCKEHDK